MKNTQRIAGTELKKSLALVTIAASFGLPFYTITTGPALTGFIRQLGAGDFVYTVIMALPVLGALLQVLVSFVIESTGRRKSIFISSGIIHRMLWAFIAAVPFIVNPEFEKNTAIWIVMILITISAMANSVVAISFNSWIGSLVPSEVKGRFFGRRTMIYTITGGLTALITGKLLDTFPGFHGYAVVFIMAAVLGLTDIVIFFWIKEPEMTGHEAPPRFEKFVLEPFKDKNYMRFCIFVAVWYFGANIAGPFFNVFMIEELKMDYFLITLFVQFAANIGTVFTIQLWGRLADKYGSRPVMKLCCMVLLALPIVWMLVTPDSIWVVLIISILSGIFWPGFELTALNQSIWLAPEKNRSVFIANYTLIVALIGTGLSFLAGGAIMELTGDFIAALRIPYLDGQYFSNYQLIFLLSCLFRIIALTNLFKGFESGKLITSKEVLADIYNGMKSKLIPK